MLGVSDEQLAGLSEEELAELSGEEEVTESLDEQETTESVDEETTIERRGKFNKSLLNRVISDPVLRYALEKCHFEFLRKVKSGKITDEEYESMRKDMKENGGEKIKFEGSLLQQISEDYIYYLALEKVDERMLRGLLNHTLTWNYKKAFAEKNGWGMIMGGGMTEKRYHDWISSKLG